MGSGVTDFIPKLRALVTKSRSDPIGFTAWDEVTLGSLAGQVARVTRDRKCFPLSGQRLPRGLGSLLESTSRDRLKAEAPCSLMNDTL